ncbi:MAG: hypothetical protein EOM50_01420 [Erysipelotrichia bacterium]|nr:hypothetical protein [Erysipelotrichia bacterium]NCC55413.1 hypothetical protein [Erysipelotrichia bacterium]
MITISSAIKQDFLIELLDKKTYDGITFQYDGKSGINLMFKIDTEDKEKAIAVAKKEIKATEIGSVLYFSIK